MLLPVHIKLQNRIIHTVKINIPDHVIDNLTEEDKEKFIDNYLNVLILNNIVLIH